MGENIQRLRRRVAAVAMGMALGVAAQTAPASAHEADASRYTFGSLAGCQGAAIRAREVHTDLGWGHHMRTKVAVVRENSCMRIETNTWSDNWTNGFRGWVTVKLLDYGGQPMVDPVISRYWVENAWGHMHARTDLQTVAIPTWAVDVIQYHGGTIFIEHVRN